jgi:hypothetical protein
VRVVYQTAVLVGVIARQYERRRKREARQTGTR